jgi:hypothetical protein
VGNYLGLGFSSKFSECSEFVDFVNSQVLDSGGFDYAAVYECYLPCAGATANGCSMALVASMHLWDEPGPKIDNDFWGRCVRAMCEDYEITMVYDDENNCLKFSVPSDYDDVVDLPHFILFQCIEAGINCEFAQVDIREILLPGGERIMIDNDFGAFARKKFIK